MQYHDGVMFEFQCKIGCQGRGVVRRAFFHQGSLLTAQFNRGLVQPWGKLFQTNHLTSMLQCIFSFRCLRFVSTFKASQILLLLRLEHASEPENVLKIQSALDGDVQLIDLEGRQGDVPSSVHEPLPEVQGCFWFGQLDGKDFVWYIWQSFGIIWHHFKNTPQLCHK